MNFNFDFRDFQKESMEKLSKIYLEAMMDQEEIIDQDPIYEKMQKILKCKEMEKCHPFLFSLDRENINETDSNKINELYECGLKRGFLTEEEPEFEPEETDDTFYDDDEPLCGGPEDSLTNQEFSDSPKTDSNIQTPVHTIFYTAMQNGEMKNGEYYSHITDKEEAKNDCILQLGNIGYSDIQIKAMEQTTQTAISDENTPKPQINENIFNEDDSEEYEKQETGDMDDSETTELTVDEKNALKTEYTTLFKEILNGLEDKKSVSEMTLEEKMNFLKELSEKWTKNDPVEFMDSDEQEKLDKYVPEEESDPEVDVDVDAEPEEEPEEKPEETKDAE